MTRRPLQYTHGFHIDERVAIVERGRKKGDADRMAIGYVIGVSESFISVRRSTDKKEFTFQPSGVARSKRARIHHWGSLPEATRQTLQRPTKKHSLLKARLLVAAGRTDDALLSVLEELERIGECLRLMEQLKTRLERSKAKIIEHALEAVGTKGGSSSPRSAGSPKGRSPKRQRSKR